MACLRLCETGPVNLEIRQFDRSDTDDIVALWEGAGLTRPWNDPHLDIERKLAVQPELFLVAIDNDVIVGSVMAGYDGHRGWIYYLAVVPLRQGGGIGRALVEEVETRLFRLGCPIVQLMVRTENREVLDFYAELGYEPFEVALAGKRLITDG